MTEKSGGIIGMHDMAVIYEVTDDFAIHRETIRVELSKEDPGSIRRTPKDLIQITVPASVPIEAFAPRLRAELEALGFTPGAGDADEE